MSTLDVKQMSFVEAGVYRRKSLNERLDRIAALINWTAIERGSPIYTILFAR